MKHNVNLGRRLSPGSQRPDRADRGCTGVSNEATGDSKRPGSPGVQAERPVYVEGREGRNGPHRSDKRLEKGQKMTLAGS